MIDSPATPGGCWTHFSHVAMRGHRSLQAGQRVELEPESPGQDGYPYRAVRVWPEGHEPVDAADDQEADSPESFASILTIDWQYPG